MQNPLASDTVPSAIFAKDDGVSPYLATLRARSAERIAKDPDFIELQKDREEFRKKRDTKSISLNEAERRREKAELDARIAARKKERAARVAAKPPTYEITLKNVDKPGLGDALKDPKPLAKAGLEFPSIDGNQNGDDASAADDIVLREAQNILADYVKLSLGGANGILVKRERSAQKQNQLCGANWATRVHANKPVPEPKNATPTHNQRWRLRHTALRASP
jgi:carboxyl-terminal processing protease